MNDILCNVKFEPDGNEISVPSGTLISKAASAVGKTIETPCGGVGTCGKCKVIVLSGKVSAPHSTELRLLNDDEVKAGVRLSCQTKVLGDVVVEIPETSKSKIQKILSQGDLRDCGIMSGISKFYCELNPPSLEDETAEYERLANFLKSRGICIKPRWKVIQTISSVVRAAQYKVTAVIRDEELISVEVGDTTGKSYGIAYDLGSTTVVGYLMDLYNGKELAVSSTMNPQMVYGGDLISRINFATTQENGALILQQSAVDALNRIAQDLVKAADIPAEYIYKATVAGNTCMMHLLLGIDVTSLGQSPYVPSISEGMCITASDLGLKIAPQANIVILPNVAGFVGSDLVAVMLSNLWENDGRTRLAVDIGTNGEMALTHKGKTYVCSAAAGPAFEGAGISCGMRGGPGAIDAVIINDKLEISTIGNKAPIGICGSGIVDAIAQMLDAGLIDETGRLISPSEAGNLPFDIKKRLFETPDGVEFVLAGKEESGNNSTIAIKQSDIRHIQLAKGSIHAAIQTLIAIAGTSDDELEEILLAGAFGNYIRIESAIRIGLIPDIDINKVTSIGNAAGAGSRLALICQQELELAKKLAMEAEHIELAVSPDYQMELMTRMMFPVTVHRN